MSSNVKAIPAGFHSVTPSLVLSDASAAIEFYKRAFGAEELARMTTPDGSKVVHAEVRIGDSVIFITDEVPERNRVSPTTLGGTSVSLALYVEDADRAFDKAVAAGARPVAPVAEMFWGDRYGTVADPYGYEWGLATHVKDLTEEEVIKGAEQYFKQMGA